MSQFALVSYLPSPLSNFLDDLRMLLTPGVRPHAHVTVLPPRPLQADLETVKGELGPALREVPPIWLRLGSIEVFPVSNVIYLGIEEGEAELRALNRSLDRGDLKYQTPFPYHPHITLAQEIGTGDVEALCRIARDAWAGYKGPRAFLIDLLWLVQNVTPGIWLECGLFPLAVEAGVPG